MIRMTRLKLIAFIALILSVMGSFAPARPAMAGGERFANPNITLELVADPPVYNPAVDKYIGFSVTVTNRGDKPQLTHVHVGAHSLWVGAKLELTNQPVREYLKSPSNGFCIKEARLCGDNFATIVAPNQSVTVRYRLTAQELVYGEFVHGITADVTDQDPREHVLRYSWRNNASATIRTVGGPPIRLRWEIPTLRESDERATATLVVDNSLYFSRIVLKDLYIWQMWGGNVRVTLPDGRVINEGEGWTEIGDLVLGPDTNKLKVEFDIYPWMPSPRTWILAAGKFGNASIAAEPGLVFVD